MKTFKKFSCIAISLALLTGSFTGCEKKKETALLDGTTEIKIFGDSEINDKGDPAWIEHVKKEKGITLTVEAPPSTSYIERLQIMLTSGDYPDLIYFKDNGIEFSDAVKSGVIIPINEFLKDKKNLQNYTYEQSWDAMKVKQSDEIFGIPRSTLIRQDAFYIRKDWLDNLGIEAPKDGTLTLDEFYEIMRRFTFDDPDGNGKNDTYGIASYNDSAKGMNLTVEETFHLYGWQKAKGGDYDYMEPKYSTTDNSYKKALEFNAKLFKEKIIDPDAPTISTYVNSTERFKRGITGVLRAFPAYIEAYINEMRKINPNADICMVTSIVDESGSSKVGTQYGTGFYGLFGVTSACKNPDKVIDLLDWILSDDEWINCMYGMEDVCYTMENGKRKFSSEVWPDLSRSLVRRNTDTAFYMPQKFTNFDYETIDAAMHKCMDNAVSGLDRGYKPSNASDPFFIDQQTALAKVTTKILLGEKPVSAYDSALKEWYANGGEKYVKEMNDYIKKMESKK